MYTMLPKIAEQNHILVAIVDCTHIWPATDSFGGLGDTAQETLQQLFW